MLGQFINRVYPRRRIGLSGLDACGKTTLVHKLKHGQVVETIPTIGIIFTTADLNITCSDGTFRCTVWETGAPGCSPRMLQRTIKSVFIPSAAIVWLVDSCDRDRLMESVEELSFLLCGDESISVTVPILILATKKDLPHAQPLNQIQKAFYKIISERPASVFAVSLVQDGPSSGLLPAFDWLKTALKTSPCPIRASGVDMGSVVPDNSESTHTKLASWVSRAETDSSPADFLSQFHSFTLPSWDHYTHIRLAYVILTTFGRQKGKDMIFEGIERYITQSSQTRARTFHVTMTYFWIQIVHFGIVSMPPLKESVANHLSLDSGRIETATVVENPLKSTSPLSCESALFQITPQSEFARFLSLNPLVTQGSLWEEFYSKDVIMTPEAKQTMVFPDKRPLPNLVVKDEQKADVGK